MFTVYTVNKRTKERKVFATVETERQALKICEEWGWSMSDYEGSYWLEFDIAPQRKEELYSAMLGYLAELIDPAELPRALSRIGFTDDEIAYEVR